MMFEFFDIRPLPPLPDLDVSEEVVMKAAEEVRVWINRALSVARDIAIDGNVKVLIQVAIFSYQHSCTKTS